MKKLFAVLMAAGLFAFVACSSPAESTESEATEDASAVIDEMESSIEEAPADTEMAEDATEDAAGDVAEEGDAPDVDGEEVDGEEETAE